MEDCNREWVHRETLERERQRKKYIAKKEQIGNKTGLKTLIKIARSHSYKRRV